ncbi:MAG: SoxR reducing system RseC family protein [Cellulosilyticaceae bacterium]
MPIGRVSSIKGEIATVIIERQDMCGECHACEITGEKKNCAIQCSNDSKGEVGDTVEIELEKSLFLRATFIMYGIPLAALVIGLALGSGIANYFNGAYKEMIMIVVGIICMAITFIVIKTKDKKKKYEALLPRIIKVIKE